MENSEDSNITVMVDSRPIVQDFDGNDALLKDSLALKQEVQQFAQAAMPEALRRALLIVTKSKSAKDVLQAAKFIKSVADGQQVKTKTIQGFVKKMSNQDLNTVLDGKDQ